MVWLVSAEEFVLVVSTTRDALVLTAVILVPPGKLTCAITMPTVKPLVSAMVMVFVVGAMEAAAKETRPRELRFRVPAFTKVPPV